MCSCHRYRNSWTKRKGKTSCLYVRVGEKELLSTLMLPSCEKEVTSEQKILAVENSAAFKGKEPYTPTKRRQEETHRGLVLK